MMTADDLRRLLQDTKPDARGPGRGENVSHPILTDCDLDLVAEIEPADPVAGKPERVSYRWTQGETWSMRGTSDSVEGFLARVVLPAIHRGASLARRDKPGASA